LSGIAEQLHTDNSILRKENEELKELVNSRKEHTSGKRMILKGLRVVTKEYIFQELEKAKAKMKEKQRKRARNGKELQYLKIPANRRLRMIRVIFQKEEECQEPVIHDRIEVQML
jgi:hypothetical protein